MLQYLCTKSIKKIISNPESLEHQIYSFRGTILGWMGSSGEASRNSRASTVCRTWPARPGARRSKRVPLGCGKTYLFANNWTLSSLVAKVLTYPAPPKKNINDEYYKKKNINWYLQLISISWNMLEHPFKILKLLPRPSGRHCRLRHGRWWRDERIGGGWERRGGKKSTGDPCFIDGYRWLIMAAWCFNKC